ncbi:MAG: CapA family protein, partial [Actinomycetes bacterium]
MSPPKRRSVPRVLAARPAVLAVVLGTAAVVAGCAAEPSDPSELSDRKGRPSGQVTSASPTSPAAAAATQPPVTTVTVTGDLMLGRRVGDRLARVGDPAEALRPMVRRLSSADLTIGNLESTLSRAGAARQGGDSFAAAPDVRRGLRLAGFDVLSLANNHVGDFGPQAMVETVRRVEAGGFLPVGAGGDLAQAAEPAVVERNGVTFGIVAFDAIGESPAATSNRPGVLRVRMRPRTGPLVRADLDRVSRIVRDLAARVDVVLVLPHWGTQYTHVPESSQR